MKEIHKNPAIFLTIKKMRFTIICVVLFITSAMGQNTKKVAEAEVCDITKDEMNELNKQVQFNISRLKAAGKLDFKKYKATDETTTMEGKTTANSILFRWPLATASYRDFPSWSIGNFVDLNANSVNDDGTDRNREEIEDYNCKDRTYDGHNGIDIIIRPYGWELRKTGFVRAVAGADGIIVYKHQGEFDMNCSKSKWQGSTIRGNNVVLLHNDGTTASFYMHMKDGSLTPKQEGDFVRQGEYLGTVASAGRSTGPHLHFQVDTGYTDNGTGNGDGTGKRVDPFAKGNCAESPSTSWIKEVPYDDPAVLTLETHYALPDYYTATCDSIISLYPSNSFGSQMIFFRSEFRDWIDGSTVIHNIYKPDGSLWHSYSEKNPIGKRIYFPPDKSYFITLTDPTGTYRYTVTFGGKTYSHYFTHKCETNKTLSGVAAGQNGTMVSNAITSTQTISGLSANYIKYMADDHVELKVGFQAAAGCRFVANLEGCNNSTKTPSAAIVKSDERLSEENSTKQSIDNARLSVNGLLISPNPSNGIFTLTYKQEKPFDAVLVIRDMTGKIVYTSQQKACTTRLEERVNLSSQAKGMYLVELNTGTQRFSGKVMLQ